MKQTDITCDVCIIGSGPSALIAGLLLNRNRDDYIIVGSKKYGELGNVHIDGRKINILPMFPLRESTLTKMLFGQEVESFPSVKYYHVDKDDQPTDHLSQKVSADSFSEFANKNGNLSLTLSYKLFGDIIFKQVLGELRSKVQHQYLSSTKKERLGFVNGKSLYMAVIEQEEERILRATVNEVDIHHRRVLMDSVSIAYNRLIVTIPLPSFLALSHLPQTFSFISSDSHFQVYLSKSQLGTNELVYDCLLDSPVYRIFTPTENVIVCQLAHNFSIYSRSIIKNRVEQISSTKIEEFGNPRTLKGAYPLQISDSEERVKLAATLYKEYGVMLFVF